MSDLTSRRRVSEGSVPLLYLDLVHFYPLDLVQHIGLLSAPRALSVDQVQHL